MTIIPGLLPILFATQLLAPASGHGEARDQPTRTARGLPILYPVGEKTIRVPSGTRLLAWNFEPVRILTAELLEPPRPGDDIISEELPDEDHDPIHAQFRAHALKRECFDLWIYGKMSVEERTIWLLAALTAKIEAVGDRGLSAAEEEKLILAGRGDIKRFFDRVEEQRAEFEAVRKDIIDGHKFLRTLQPLSIEFQLGLFDFNSFFSKTLRKIENDRKKTR